MLFHVNVILLYETGQDREYLVSTVDTNSLVP